MCHILKNGLLLPLLLFYVSRIYSKFSAKKMQELSEAGLMNFLLLFLVVARNVELEDVASRACELLGFLPSNCPTGHRALVWRGQLSLLLLFQVCFLIKDVIWKCIVASQRADAQILPVQDFLTSSDISSPGEGSGCWCTGQLAGLLL